MANSSPVQSYSELTPAARHIAHLAALSGETLKPNDLASLSRQAGWCDAKGKTLTQAAADKAFKSLVSKKILYRSYNGGGSINPDVQDLAIQDVVRDARFELMASLIEKRYPLRQHGHSRQSRLGRDLRIAFYTSDIDTFNSLFSQSGQSNISATVLQRFDQRLFDQLDPILQQMYLVDVFPRLIISGEGQVELIAAIERLLESSVELSDDLIASGIDFYVATGRLDALGILDQRTSNRHPEIAGCMAVLAGDYERAEVYFSDAMPIGKRGSRGSKTALRHLPGVLYLLLLMRKGSAESQQLMSSLLVKIDRSQGSRYTESLDVFHAAIAFQSSPRAADDLVDNLKRVCTSPLNALLAGYAWNWNLSPDEAPFQTAYLVRMSSSYAKLGMNWLAAELAGLAGKSSLKSATTQTAKSVKLHNQLRTSSLVNATRPVAKWERALRAIGNLTASKPAVKTPVAQSEQRLLWEIRYLSDTQIDLRAVLQKQTAKGWTKGRYVALSRLYEQHNDPEYSFLSDQDLAICRSVEAETERGRYGYSDTTYSFDDFRVAGAMIGHPCIFREGDRQNPVEVVEQEPHLVVAKKKNKRIELSLNPAPPSPVSYWDDECNVRFLEDGPRRLAVTFFTDQHQALNDILGDSLTVPEAALQQVTESIQSIASLISIHSDFDVNTPEGKTQAALPHPHLHLLPYHSGLQLRFYVRPFGEEEGPFFVPGDGGETVVAKIGDQTKTAQRDLSEERRRQAEVISACPTIAIHADSESICFPSPAEALETMLELEDLVAKKKVTLHWPQGRKFQLAGQGLSSQLRINVRKDRDWFAASGDLKVNKSLSIDLMKLIDLVEDSPSRFVELDDGQFLALTEQLRRQIEDLGTFGERAKGKLRFPPIRTTVMEELEDSISLKADKHWKQWLTRMRDAGEVHATVPSTLSAQLRDYQLEGFQWLARLAHWEAGACLADDMGLGKTIEALALLLHRCGDGPALIVAPTSVAFNWQSEIHRFAPTLNAHLFGTGDRDEALRDLGPRDVVICSYGLLHSEADRLQALRWHTVVLDEAQAIKNVTTKRSQAAMGLQAGFRMILTGTPLENHLGELWNLFQFINPGLLGSYDSFQQRFAIPIERDGCRETRRRLKKLIQPFILRRTKSQVLEELPSRTEVTLKVTLSEAEAAHYEALRQRAVEKLADNDDDRPKHLQILAELMRLRRACCHPRLVTKDVDLPSSKLALFTETLDELLDNQHKVLVFSQFVDHLTVIREELDRKEISYQYLDGSTRAKQRKQRVEAFQAGQGDVFLISLKAGGLGLNLTAADYVIHMDPWWNPAVEDQASDRAHRLGQLRPVTIYRLITTGTIEERITNLHATKRDLADSLLQGTDMTGKLSAKQLLQLIRE